MKPLLLPLLKPEESADINEPSDDKESTYSFLYEDPAVLITST